MRVKICGITNLEDALVAIEAGADALGFVFYEKSPRYIHPQEAKIISKKLPPFVERVGLFVHEEPVKIDEICSYCNMSLAQIHFDVEESFFEKLQTKALPVVRAKCAEDILQFSDRYRLVDAYVPEFGGAGRRVALEWFENIDCSKIVLAGGLSPKNVSEVKRYGFYGVDVSSGVEARKGKKDPQKVREFIQKAKFE
ncbi:phosphoribosylanthranilate isomerase [Nitratiruptor sp. SB155-2]|uniref:N-(5'-phosphoribosyl)anthranilate isomerase n=1 Tax=Nitratiruptor sp. (strain SB155-2) TaxID=387092 RepID=TRPF_NITSB|nr:phosphoribosylanthranilate isomerase [Nitratiruptor sp. SB155-2]A6Q1S6.1 RecName: Full=N-(5'-phosphoribosyl)anthranilate isomerase; Short=PRAI [Nitratiruptor sp. SB155-2]BAF69435.1 phosphoribosylanthranilate isomerase [Nitratiruptor sp. SB155-2]